MLSNDVCRPSGFHVSSSTVNKLCLWVGYFDISINSVIHAVYYCCNLSIGDQVSRKGGMTGGFYDYRRSKLKLMTSIRENNKLVNVKQEELTQVRAELQNILWTLLHVQFTSLSIAH